MDGMTTRRPPEIVTEETTAIDQLFLELSQFTRARTRDERLYDALLYAVGNKYRDETRHETALRYIRNAEREIYGPAQTDQTA